ncbi:MAG: secondary thiamine-phosphate synthase enzyme YjbQ [Candidatus Gracilibacteria bacterium]|nr:secondary thiamine-phosphate synthase enzyme YjbQ [Candidatus Gracilibacteria bacterium]
MKTKTLSISTEKFFDIHDLTQTVQDFLQEIGAKEGLVNVFTRHTTCAVRINELEDGLMQDMKDVFFTEIARPDRKWKHNDLDGRAPETMCASGECQNGHSHVIQMLLGSGETVPVQQGKMQLGTWQHLLFFELDRPRNREVVLSFVGECG